VLTNELHYGLTAMAMALVSLGFIPFDRSLPVYICINIVIFVVMLLNILLIFSC